MKRLVLDTCVLWPSTLRDFLLSVAAEEAFLPLWGFDILNELEWAEERKLLRSGVSAAQAKKRASDLRLRMLIEFPDSLVMRGVGSVKPAGLPDPMDEHVLAVAVAASADAVVTSNLRDFPATRVPTQLDVLSPAEAIANLVLSHATACETALLRMSARSGKVGPRMSAGDLRARLGTRYGLMRALAPLQLP